MSKKQRFKRIVALSVCSFLFTSSCFAAFCQWSAEKSADTILSQDPSFSLSREDLIRAIEFIETRLRSEEQEERFSSEETGIPCLIERSPSLEGCLIRELHKKDYVGRGGQKIVRKAAFYGAFPKMVAECQCRGAGKREIRVFGTVKGERGIVPFLGFSSDENNRHMIYLEYFPEGSFEKQIKEKNEFSEQQTIKILLDICHGVQALHSNNLVHQDLHSRNMLIRLLPNSLVESVLIDFGHTKSVESAQKRPPDKSPGRAPPEALLQSPDSIDRYKAEIYALGSTFYRFIFKRFAPWVGLFKNLDPNLSSEEKEALFAQIVSLYNETKEQKIQAADQGGNTVAFKKLTEIIFQMVHYDPQKRPSIENLIEQLDLLYLLTS